LIRRPSIECQRRLSEREEERISLIGLWCDWHIRREWPGPGQRQSIVVFVQEQGNARPAIRRRPLASVTRVIGGVEAHFSDCRRQRLTQGESCTDCRCAGHARCCYEPDRLGSNPDELRSVARIGSWGLDLPDDSPASVPGIPEGILRVTPESVPTLMFNDRTWIGHVGQQHA
jgi:hypothetical protein